MHHHRARSSIVAGLVTACLCAALSGCSDPGSEPESEALEDCSVVGKNRYVQAVMKDAYFWYKKVPDVSPADYGSPESMLDALVYKDLDRWSYTIERSAYDAYFDDGTTLGFGFRWKYDAAGDVRFSLIQLGSPAYDAGLARGDKVVSVGGISIEEIASQGLWEQVLGEEEEGVTVPFVVEDIGGTSKEVLLEKKQFTLQTVHLQNIVEVGESRVGYLFFTNFLGSSEPELLEAWSSFAQAGVTDLVLDLRYNPGGQLAIGQLLSGLIVGSSAENLPWVRLLHNDQHKDWNGTYALTPSLLSLGLERVFIITGEATASASESVINGLAPYVEVRTIGGTTHGKPVGMYPWSYCDFLTVPITFEVVNADGDGGYFDGLAPDCAADDDMTIPLGHPSDPSLTTALHLMQYGTCPDSATGAGAKKIGASREIPRRGFRAEIGSY